MVFHTQWSNANLTILPTDQGTVTVVLYKKILALLDGAACKKLAKDPTQPAEWKTTLPS
jgi:hypothetical protein